VLLVGVILGVLLVVKGAHPSIHSQTKQQGGISAPDVVGMREPRAAAILRASGLSLAVVYVRHHPTGVVVAEVPAAGTRVGRGGTVLLRIGRAG
jgi:beta-lactam-binding protein with PASTA domain